MSRPDLRELEDALREVQSHYPKIYLACHTRHQRARSTTYRLAGHDSSVLSHLEEGAPTSPAILAKHLGVAPSTLSATLERLGQLGYLKRQRRASDRRHVDLWLTARGAKAMQASSVLESRRVRRLLQLLGAKDRRKAVEGLAILARAATDIIAREGKGAPR